MKILLVVAFVAHARVYYCVGASGSPCWPGSANDNHTENCTSTSPGAVTDQPGRACEIGLAQCSLLEVCRGNKQNNRSRTGACYCKDGYVRNVTSGICQPRVERFEVITASPNAGVSGTAAPVFTVRLIGPRRVILPADDVNITAEVEWSLDNKTTAVDESGLKYSWTLKSSPLNGGSEAGTVVLEGRENRTLHLHALREGDYVLGVRVISGNRTGDAEWTMTVLAEQKHNPPLAIIQPPVEVVKENTQVILDGSSSKDTDGTIADYVWTQIDGPVMPGSNDGVLARTPTLTLSNLHAGNYSFRLTVTDGDGFQSSALSKVYVAPEVNYPPKAVAGSCDGILGDVEIRLPVDALYLCGNASTDDKGIVKWTWTLKDTYKNTADMEGTGSSILKVSNLHAGDYTFQLVVEDEKGQSASADVHVVVMPAVNKAPVAEAGQNRTIKYPGSSIILDGVFSSDDKQIASFQWSQIEGPSKAVLTNADKPRMTATELQPGVYAFELNVTDDDGLSDVDRVYITVDANDNRPPVAVASDVTVTLPCNMVSLNASASSDDAGVVRWLWTLQDDSPTGLELLGNSWQQPTLLVSNLALGAYVFNLTVFDKQGAAGSKLVKLSIVHSDKDTQSVEIYLGIRFADFTVRHQKKLNKQLQALMETNPIWDRVNIYITKVTMDPRDGSVRLLFYTTVSLSDSVSSEKIMPASTVADFLETHWSRSEFMSEFSIKSVDSLYCHSNCSGRGRCEDYTKRCVCHRYWMPNLFLYYSRGVAKDCDWSVLYFVVVILLVLCVPIGASCIILRAGCGKCRACRGVAVKTRAAAKRIRRYRMLKDDESPRKKVLGLKTFRGRGNGHVPVVSDSDLSSEEETVYDRSSLLPKHRDEDPQIANGTIAA